MAVDAFIWFEEAGAGGKLPLGETLDKKYSEHKAFEIKDFSFSIENPSTIGSATSGAGAGKAKFNEVEITKTPDKASPTRWPACGRGPEFSPRSGRGDGSCGPRPRACPVAFSDY